MDNICKSGCSCPMCKVRTQLRYMRDDLGVPQHVIVHLMISLLQTEMPDINIVDTELKAASVH